MQERGKSTLVKFIISALEQQYDIDPEKDVVYTSFTGKATQVLQKKGNKNVSTLHKMLFESIPRPDGTFFRKPVTYLPYKIVVVDECSMVPKELLDRANEVLKVYEGNEKATPVLKNNQIAFDFDAPEVETSKALERLDEVDPLKVTPMDAINLLYEIKELREHDKR